MFLICLLLCPLWVVSGQENDEEKKVLLVVDFKAKEGVSRATAETVTGFIRTSMVKLDLFTVVERSSLESLVKEQALQETGITENKAVEIGRMLAAEKILTGTVSVLKDGFAINGNIIDVEEGRINFSASETADREDLLAIAAENLCRRIAGRILGIADDELVLREPPRWPYVWRSALLPGWGQYYGGSEWRALSYLSVGGGLLAYYAVSYANYRSVEADYRGAIILPQDTVGFDTYLFNRMYLNQKRDALRAAEGQQNSASYAVMGFWIWNMMDAYLFWGGSPDKAMSVQLYPAPLETASAKALRSDGLRMAVTLKY